jgi:hypothetical protein
MDGKPIGLDMAACLARPTAAQADQQALEFLLLSAESGAVKAATEK